MDTKRFDIMLDANDENFEQQLFDALGIKPGDEVQIVTPQFDRVDGRAITYFPRTVEEYAALPTYSRETLKKLGCQPWDKEGDTETWLFPKEWYSVIPDGLEVVDICGERERFKRGVTDDDCRFGVLAFGFEVRVEKAA